MRPTNHIRRSPHFVSSVIDAAMELDLCVAELVGPHQVATRLLDKAIWLGSTQNAQDCSTFVANVVCPEAAIDSATRDRIKRILAGDGFSIVLQPIIYSDWSCCCGRGTVTIHQRLEPAPD